MCGVRSWLACVLCVQARSARSIALSRRTSSCERTHALCLTEVTDRWFTCRSRRHREAVASFIEELVIRRELSGLQQQLDRFACEHSQ